jgi:E3 ubiquitin-protein ligase HECTD2
MNSNMKKGRCFCCNSLLQYPQEVTCFRCTVCNTINDIKPILQRKEENSILSYDTLVTLNEMGNIGIMLEYINCYFSRYCNLNESFKLIDTKDHNSIDFEELWKTYDYIENLHEPVATEIINSLMILLKRPGKILQNISDIRFLLIIFECPIFFHNTTQEEKLRNHEVLKRLFGLISCLTNDLHKYIVSVITSFSEENFKKKIEIVNHFISYHLMEFDDMLRNYSSDWSIKAASRVMALLNAANHLRSPSLPISELYNIGVDLIDICGDYNNWQNVQFNKYFSFCQYPFLISLGQKINILRMESKQYLTTIIQTNMNPYFSVHIRRDHLIQDSLDQIQIALKSGVDMKRRLNVKFVGEDGVDAGGLRKEWLFLLVKELFDPKFGMFNFDEETGLCWFNPASFENENQYKFLGIIIGLAIYNNIILDIRLPLACYKRLLNYNCNLEDLREIHPRLARGFDQLMEYENDDIEDVFCLNFVATYSEYDKPIQVPLIPNGENISVNMSNRKEYIDQYIYWFFIKSVQKKFEAFREGFNLLCSGNLLSLCRPEEIQKMILGEEEIDIDRLRGVTTYKNCDADVQVVKWFWEVVGEYNEEMKKKFMIFVTGSDRICPTGIEDMKFTICYYEYDAGREYLPQTHTCFNEILLFKYASKESLADKLQKAISYSEGFGIK